MLNATKLAWKFLWREWRAGEWLIVFFALWLSVAALTGLHFYTDRLLRGFNEQSAKFLGGDVVISSSTAIPKNWEDEAHRLQLKTAQVWSYPSVLSTQNHLQLINLQAVSDTYPLLVDEGPGLPERGTIWLEARLLPLLALKPNDRVTVGATTLRATQILKSDVDMLNTGLVIAPRALMRLSDVPATQTVLPGSRINYRLLLVGNANQLQQFRHWITPQLKAGQRLLDIHNQQFILRNTLGRIENYLQLALLVCLVMSGVAIALSIQQYLRHHYAHVALWRCLGARQSQIIGILLWQLFFVAFITALLGITVGYFSQAVFADLFKEYLRFTLPSAGIAPVSLGFLTSTIVLFAFALPIVTCLPKTSPLHLWRGNLQANNAQGNFYLVIALIVLFIFLYWLNNFSLITLLFLHALLVSVGILFGLSLIILKLLNHFMGHLRGPMRFGVGNLVRHATSVSMQLTGFSLILMCIFLLGLVRNDLLQNWHSTLPPQTPNYFAINIAPNDVIPLKNFFQQHNIKVEGIYPMARGRLIALNNQPVLSVVPENARSNNVLRRELNLSWMWQLPSDNKIVQGEKWTIQDQGKAVVSVEQHLAKELNFHIGDRLTFQVGDQSITATIKNFRTLEWGSLHPNFYMIFTPGLLDNFPATYITSFHLLSKQTESLNGLIQQFPNITVIDAASLLQQVQALLDKITLAMQFLLLFALGIGILIFIVSLQASMHERLQTYKLIHVLGAGKKFIRLSLIMEFGCLSVLILFTSITLAYLISYLLGKYIFNF